MLTECVAHHFRRIEYFGHRYAKILGLRDGFASCASGEPCIHASIDLVGITQRFGLEVGSIEARILHQYRDEIVEPVVAMDVDVAIGAIRRPNTSTIIADPNDLRRTSIDQVSDLVSSALPTLLEQEHHHGTITIVFSDIEGSTERVSASGDEQWFQVLALHNDVIRRQVRRFGGTEVKNQGDGFMLTFPSARRAIQAMAAVQREFSEESTRAKTADMRIRVGMHTGEVIVEDGDLFGHHVHLASRIASQATGGEILVSSLTKALLETRGDVRFGEPREVQLKGITASQTVHPVLWGPEA